MKRFFDYSEIEGKSLGFYALLGIVGIIILAGLGAAYYMEHNGHYVTGMNNQVVWGIPHVFAIFLIVAASGALNVASVRSVFAIAVYRPLARLSGLLAITLLVGGLAVLVLDLGRADRLMVAATHFNFKSIFTWNIFLYTGFLLIIGIYLWLMMERRMNKYYRIPGFIAFIWRLVLTTGTGSIFGFLVARQAYDAAIMAPMFVIMSFALGLAVFLLALISIYYWTGRTLGTELLRRLKNLLGVFVGALLYFTLVYHLTNLYVTENHDFEYFILISGGVFPLLFWGGHILVGSLTPLLFLYHPFFKKSPSAVVLASLMVIIGGFCQLYVIIVGGQTFPLDIFPGKEVLSSSFFDGAIASYTPSHWEIMLGVGGIAISIFMTVVAIRLLPFLPVSLADARIEHVTTHKP